MSDTGISGEKSKLISKTLLVTSTSHKVPAKHPLTVYAEKKESGQDTTQPLKQRRGPAKRKASPDISTEHSGKGKAPRRVPRHMFVRDLPSNLPTPGNLFVDETERDEARF